MSFLSQPITLQSIFGANRKIGTITVNAIINEETNDTLTITKQPVQQGASITDHAYNEPTALSMTILQQVQNPITQFTSTFAGAGNGGLAQLYQEFLDLQSQIKPFVITTPKRVYKDMLISVIRMVTDKKTENILALNLSFQQVIIVSIGTATIAASSQSQPQVTQGTQNVGNQSVLLTGFQSVFPGIQGVSQ